MGMKRISLAIIAASLLLIPAFAFAQVGAEGVGQTVLPNSQTSGLPPSQTSGGVPQNIVPQTTYTNTNTSGGSATVQNPLGGINSFCGLIKAILGAVIQIGIPIAVLFIVWAGFKFVLARGNAGKLDEARKNLMYTLIGIGIFLGAWLIATVIANTVNSLGAGSGSSSIISCN